MLEGVIVSVLDSEVVQVMQRGDIVVQGATMRAWRNTSVQWARILFALQDCKKVERGEKLLTENLARGAEDLPYITNAGWKRVQHVYRKVAHGLKRQALPLDGDGSHCVLPFFHFRNQKDQGTLPGLIITTSGVIINRPNFPKHIGCYPCFATPTSAP